MGKKKDTFIFKKSWADALEQWSDDIKLEVYNAIISYAFTGGIPQMSQAAGMAFSFIKNDIDVNNSKYEEVIKKRSEAGRRGMESRYRKNEEAESEDVDNKSNTPSEKVTPVTNDNKSNKCYQELTNVTDNVYDYVNDIKKETISNEIVKKEGELLSSPSHPEVLFEDDSEGLLDESIVVEPKINYERIVKMYNSICVGLPAITRVTQRRREKIRKRFQELGYDYSALERLFRKVQSSEFLTGDNGRGWRADFDWIFKNAENWLSIVEGKYDKTFGKSGKSELQKNLEFMDSIGVKQENVIF